MNRGQARLKVERAAHMAECAARRGPPAPTYRPDTDEALRANPGLLERLAPGEVSEANRFKAIGFNGGRRA